MERYTLLLTTEDGVVLYDLHRRRLNPDGDPAVDAVFARFAGEAPPGVHAVWIGAEGALRSEVRSGSRLREGMSARFLVSPLAGGRGPVPKPAPPSPYDAVRAEGVATLLTSADGAEIYEACVAAVLGWDGRQIVCVPADRPRIWSTAEAAVREHLSVSEAPILTASATPILLVNAVKVTCCVNVPGRGTFPSAVQQDIQHLLVSLTADG